MSVSLSNTCLSVLFSGLVTVGSLTGGSLQAQPAKPKTNDSTTPLHLLQPDYPVPYGQPKIEEVTGVIRRIYTYLDANTPTQLIDKETKKDLVPGGTFNPNAIFKPGDFRLVSYEWGVTYAGMLAATEATGDARYAEYTNKRLQFIAGQVPYFRAQVEADPKGQHTHAGRTGTARARRCRGHVCRHDQSQQGGRYQSRCSAPH